MAVQLEWFEAEEDGVWLAQLNPSADVIIIGTFFSPTLGRLLLRRYQQDDAS
jgi:hypothetical protein